MKQIPSSTDDKRQDYIQMLSASFLLGGIMLIMGLVDLWCRKPLPGAAAVIFAAINLVSALLIYRLKRVHPLNFAAFALSALAYSLYLMISGGATGLGPVWILLLPLYVTFLFGTKWGSAAALLLFAGVVFLLDTPWGGAFLMYDYPPEFRLQFPLAYLSFFAIGLLFELLHAAAIHRADEQCEALEQLSRIDLLTGINNRWWYNEQLKKRNSQPEYRRRYAVFLIDIDRFKDINDTYGHLYGDEVLVTVARTIKQVLQDGGIVCRWGGDEFLSQSRAASNEETLSIAERIQKCVSETSFTAPDGTPFTVTVSIGAVYVPNPQDVYSTELFSIADQALYEAKNSGRNRVGFRTTQRADGQG